MSVDLNMQCTPKSGPTSERCVALVQIALKSWDYPAPLSSPILPNHQIHNTIVLVDISHVLHQQGIMLPPPLCEVVLLGDIFGFKQR